MAIDVDAVFGEMPCRPSATSSRDLMVYLHIPFCRYRCTFCDWVNGVPANELISRDDFHDRYVEALCRQIRDIGPRLAAMGYVVRLMYWGGGTPTVLDPHHHGAVMQALGESFDLTTVVEHSLESTPDALTPEKVRGLKALGVNRFSVGLQSTDPDQLRKSGRRHSPERIGEAVGMLRAEGMDNFNLDVIVGFPEQTIDDITEMIETCIALGPAHLSLYPYRPSEGTQMAAVMKKGRRQPLARSALRDMFGESESRLRAAGYAEYTTGYFAKSRAYQFQGERYYFNLEGDFVGFGAGAASIVCQRRFATRRDSISAFIDNPLEFASCDKFSPEHVDALLPLLRPCIITDEGIQFDRFRRLFGFDFADVRDHPVIAGYLEYFRACGAEYIEDEEGLRVRPATRTLAHLNSYGASVEYKVASTSAPAIPSARHSA
jgi:coproporphyrinogen III oxidase-like Fe-S oxidoreductase